jgi:hypothetical protein
MGGQAMIRQEYLDYVAGFSNLNPYELDHMSEKMYVQMEKILQNRTHDDQAEVQFSTSDIKDIITKAMRCIYIELANQKKVEFDLQLEKIKSMTFEPEEITQESVIAHKQKMSSVFPQDKKDPTARRQGHRTEAA